MDPEGFKFIHFSTPKSHGRWYERMRKILDSGRITMFPDWGPSEFSQTWIDEAGQMSPQQFDDAMIAMRVGLGQMSLEQARWEIGIRDRFCRLPDGTIVVYRPVFEMAIPMDDLVMN